MIILSNTNANRFICVLDDYIATAMLVKVIQKKAPPVHCVTLICAVYFSNHSQYILSDIIIVYFFLVTLI